MTPAQLVAKLAAMPPIEREAWQMLQQRRDAFASAAMTALVIAAGERGRHAEDVARQAAKLADAMMAAL